MIEGCRNYLELQESTYEIDFKRRPAQFNTSLQNIKIDRLLREKLQLNDRSRKKKKYWTGSSLVKIEQPYIPRFNEFQHEPKEIIHTSPIINIECTAPGALQVHEVHKKVMQTRPRYAPTPSAPILDDMNHAEGRHCFVDFTYRIDHIPLWRNKNSEFGENVYFPALKYSTEQLGSIERRYRFMESKLKTYLRNHEDIQERNYDNFCTNYSKIHRRASNLCKKSWNLFVDRDMIRLNNTNCRLGFAWFAATKSMKPQSAGKSTVDPRLSFSEAKESRYDKKHEHLSAELKKALMGTGQAENRKRLGIFHAPIEKYYVKKSTGV